MKTVITIKNIFWKGLRPLFPDFKKATTSVVDQDGSLRHWRAFLFSRYPWKYQKWYGFQPH
jgi:hypothetical protein